MFSSKPKDVPAFVPAATQIRKSARPSAPSIICADLTVTGGLTSSGDIQVEGLVEGDVRSISLVVGEKAEIRGEIFAEEVTIRGRVMGRIRARKVHLAATSHVEGDILHEAFAVEAGAFFEGSCRRSDDPLSDEAKRIVQTETAQPAMPFMPGLAVGA